VGLFGPKINDPYNTMGGAQPAARNPKFRESQVGKILETRRKYDRGEATAADLLKVVKQSTGHEINAAMDDYGEGTESWSRIKDDD
jgi:hypothetical protein